MALGPHALFIVASYVATFGAVAGLIAWTVADYRRQKRLLAELEARGVTRRSAAGVKPKPIEETA